MRKHLLELVSLVMLTCMILSITTGCGKGTKDISNSDKKETKEVTKPTAIKYMTSIGFTEQEDRNLWIDEFEKLTGIKLNLVMPSNNEYYEKLDLAFASGDIPDVCVVGDERLAKYASQGTLKDITKLAEDSEIVKGLDQTVVNAAKINKNIYGIPYENGGGPITYIRTDWLKKVDKSVPKTYSEFIDVLKAFKTIGTDSIPFTAPGLYCYMYLDEFYQDARPQYTFKNGKWVDGFLEIEMKSALQRMRYAYDDGLIDKEILTNKTTTCRDKWISGRVGAFSYWAGDWNMTLDDRMKDGPAGKNASMEAIPAIKETKYIMRVPPIVAISNNCKNPEGVFKYFIEYMHDGKEGSMLFRHGVEDKHYLRDLNGKVTGLPTITKANQTYKKAFIGTPMAIEKMTIPYNFDIDPRVKQSLDVLSENSVPDLIVPGSKTLNKVTVDVQTLREQTLSKVVSGQITVDRGLENYKKEINNLGQADILSEMNVQNK
jgi:putative aldouronate transport system substrate-binding protein